MVMTEEPASEVAWALEQIPPLPADEIIYRRGMVLIRCTGERKSGAPCNALLAVVEVRAFDGVLRIKCPKCGEIAIFR